MYNRNHRMAAGLCGLLFASLGSVAADSTSLATPLAKDPHALWQDVDATAIRARGEAWVQPQIARALTLDYAALQAHLARAPMEGTVTTRSSATTFSLPMPDGGFAEFAIVESPVMEAGLAAKYPSIRTYAGQGLHDPAATLRLDVTPLGFHAQVLSPRGDFYIDPYQKADNEHYLAYFRRNHVDSDAQPRREIAGASLVPEHRNPAAAAPLNPSGTTLRTYRLAIATLPSYALAFGGSKLAAFSGVITTVNRLSGIYEREVAVRLVLPANNDALIYTVANPGTFRDPPRTIDFDDYQTTFDSVIGAGNYELGQVLGGYGSDFGYAQLGSVCGIEKAQAFATFDTPSGDAFDVDLVAHNVGHSLGAIHTAYSCGGSVPNWYAEPRTGSTIMGFAGVCDDLQPHSDAYLHTRSFDDIFAYTSIGGAGNNNTACGTQSATGNTPPTISAPSTLRIPQLTPFQLTATGGDADVGDLVSFNWEQVDGVQFVTPEVGTPPAFRSFNASLSPTRVFPSLIYILENANVPPSEIPWVPASSSAPFYSGELLPTPLPAPAGMYREMNFRVTARDNRAAGGGVRHAPTQVLAYASSGPFTVGNIDGSVAGGSSHAITWAVANTTAQPVATSLLNIQFSQDGGQTFTNLLANTANDGAQTITMPDIATTHARIRIEAANGNGVSPGNTWFDINDANFAVTSNGSGITIGAGAAIVTQQGSSAPSPVTIATIAGGTPPYTATAEFHPLNPQLSIQNLQVAGASVSASASASCSPAVPNDPSYRIFSALLQVTDSANRRASAVFPVRVDDNEMPAIGTYLNRIVARGLSINATPTATPFDPNGNIASISVSPTTLPGGGSVSVDSSTGVVTINAGAMAALGPQTIRVTVLDSCGAAAVQDFVVNVALLAPSLILNGHAVTSGNAVIEPNECNTMELTLGNVGGLGATAISSTLSTSTPGVTVTLPQSNYPDIASGGAGVNNSGFEINTAANVACGSTIDLTHTVSQSGGGAPSTFNFSVPVGQPNQPNYVITATDGAAPVPGMTLVAGSQGDDEVAPITNFPAGFNFRIYGTPVTQLAVSTNGILGFNTATGAGSGTAGNHPLPHSGPFTTSALVAFWDDLDTRSTTVSGGGVYTTVAGQTPNRIFDIEWRAKRYQSSSLQAPTVVFTARLHETTNLIEVVYTSVGGNPSTPDPDGAPNGSSATIGIQAATSGTDFTQFSYDTMSLVAGRKLTFARTAGFCSVGTAMCVDPALRLFRDNFE